MKNVKYRLAEDNDKDFEDLLLIKSDYDNICWAGFEKAPERTSFRKWYTNQINNLDRDIYLVFHESNNNHAVAFFYVDWREDGEFLVPSGVIKEYTRQGIGTFIIEEADKIAKSKGFTTHVAWVSDSNIGSVKRFEKLNYQKTEVYDVRHLPLLGGDHKYYKWIKKI